MIGKAKLIHCAFSAGCLAHFRFQQRERGGGGHILVCIIQQDLELVRV